ncbi:uncharacterized protein [Rutidosis leptorrhynchoides]|uniref:uncharacterized protein n=1 Tax=Rutidosis leptorrhynchoides TaxID=125765 RepID=UPI003A98F9DC
MGKRKGRQSKTLLINSESNHDGENDEFRSNDLEEEESGFFACYLLTSLCPRYKGHTYIGFTVNPRRRIRQHNGELCSGAFRTKKKRPWEMVLCIHGFPTNTVALQFEWAWQHPVESLAVRKAAVGFKSLNGLANKIKLAYTMLTLPAWNNLNLTVNFFSTKYTKHYAGCPTLPSQMRVHIRSMDELPCYTEGYKEIEEDDMFKYDNDISDDEEPEKASGSRDSEGRDEDVTLQVPVFADHDNNQEASHILDTEFNKQPSYSNNIWDEDEEFDNIVASYDEEATYEDNDITMPVLVSANNHNNKVEAICVSDDEEYGTKESTGWLFDNISKSSFTDLNNCRDVSQTMENKNGGIPRNKDGTRNKICVSVGEVEVIDVFSPSPEYRPSTRRKKTEGSGVCPEIIDLTQSPICV